MRTLIIPCAGSRMLDNMPLFLNKHPEGTLLAHKAIQGVFLNGYDRIIYTVLEEINSKYEVVDKIKAAFGEVINIEVVVLKEMTSGPAETIYNTLIQANVQDEFVVRDSHSYIEIEKDCRGNFIAGLDLTRYHKTIENLREKSFIVLNEQEKVLDVVEKHFCSDVISVGLYGFKSTKDYIMAYKRLRDKNYPIDKLYLSHIISYLIGYKQRVFHSVKVTKFEDWSTKSVWQKIQKSYTTCFINIDILGGFCIPYKETVMQKLIKLSENGVRFIGFTSEVGDINVLVSYLRSNNVSMLNIISGCTNSKMRTLVVTIPELEDLLLEVL